MISTIFRERERVESDSSDISAPSYSVITPTDGTFSDLSDEPIDTMHEDQVYCCYMYVKLDLNNL